ncbi:hypothetical protein JOB18_036491 [Solea senegalensis]|nr:hypothetical protein JOB18_036491 [Solea senegalensis]
MEEKRQAALKYLNELFPNDSCVSMNITEGVGAELQSLDASPLSPFRHCMEKVVALTPELSPQLLTIGQYIQHMVQPGSDHTPSHNCSIPSFEHELEKYSYVKCLLQLLGEWLNGLSGLGRPSKVA